jgi:hypothetical protein
VKAALILGCLLILTNAPASPAQEVKMGDPNYHSVNDLEAGIGWYYRTDSKTWTQQGGISSKGAECMIALNKLRDAGFPDTRVLEVRYDAPEFKRGPHTLAEIRTSCEHVVRFSKIKNFELWAGLARKDTPNLQKGHYTIEYYKNCRETYRSAIDAGVSPSEHLPDQSMEGSIKEIREQWCDPGFHEAKDKNEAAAEPYRKALANDKLKVALTYQEVILPGGARTTNPQKMAQASVWFEEFEPTRYCNDGRQIHMIRRYQFDSGQKTVKTTEQDYCGGAPLSAYR